MGRKISGDGNRVKDYIPCRARPSLFGRMQPSFVAPVLPTG